MKIGDVLSEEMKAHQGPSMGPVVSEGQYKKIQGYLSRAQEQGLVFLCGAEQDQQQMRACSTSMGEKGEKGYFIHPVVLVDVPVTSEVWVEEIFGPVLCVRVRSSKIIF